MKFALTMGFVSLALGCTGSEPTRDIGSQDGAGAFKLDATGVSDGPAFRFWPEHAGDQCDGTPTFSRSGWTWNLFQVVQSDANGFTLQALEPINFAPEQGPLIECTLAGQFFHCDAVRLEYDFSFSVEGIALVTETVKLHGLISSDGNHTLTMHYDRVCHGDGCEEFETHGGADSMACFPGVVVGHVTPFTIPTGPSNFASCQTSADCGPGESCLFAGTGNVCSYSGCTDVSQCGEATSGTIEPVCRAFTPDTPPEAGKECWLDCANGGECPQGMACVNLGDIVHMCLWPDDNQ